MEINQRGGNKIQKTKNKKKNTKKKQHNRINTNGCSSYIIGYLTIIYC